MGKWFEEDTSKKKIYKWIIHTWKHFKQHGGKQTTITMIYGYTSTWMAIIKKTDDTKCWQSVEQLELLSITGGNVKQSNHFRNYSGTSEKVKHALTLRPSDSTPRYFTQEIWKHVHKNTCIIFTAIVFISKLETTQMNINRRMDKLWCILTTIQYYSAIKRNSTCSHTTDESHKHYAKCKKTNTKESHILCDFIHMKF